MEKQVKPKIIIVEDDERIGKSFAGLLGDLGYDCHLVYDFPYEKVIAKLEEETKRFQPNLAIVDGLYKKCFQAIEIIEKAKQGVECVVFSLTPDELRAKMPAGKDYKIFDKFKSQELIEYIKRKYPVMP